MPGTLMLRRAFLAATFLGASLVIVALVALTAAPALAGCKRTICNTTQATYRAECKGCQTPWRTTIPAGRCVRVEFTEGWDNAYLVLSSPAKKLVTRVPNPSVRNFGAWIAPGGRRMPFQLGEVGDHRGGAFLLQVRSGQEKLRGNFCVDFAYYRNGNRLRQKGVRGTNNTFLTLHRPAHMDVRINQGVGSNNQCVYVWASAAPFRRNAYLCRCIDFKTASRIPGPGPCNQPGKVITWVPRAQSDIPLMKARRHPAQLRCRNWRRHVSRWVDYRREKWVNMRVYNRSGATRRIIHLESGGLKRLVREIPHGKDIVIRAKANFSYMVADGAGQCRLILKWPGRAKAGGKFYVKRSINYVIRPYW